MLIKIDNPINLWWSSIYMLFIQNGGQNADIWHIYSCGYKKNNNNN